MADRQPVLVDLAGKRRISYRRRTKRSVFCVSSSCGASIMNELAFLQSLLHGAEYLQGGCGL